MGVAERKEREKELRRSAIVDAAEKVFFARGLDNATTDEVAETAELSKGTLYLYFKNKNELLHAIVGRGLEILYKNFQEAVDTDESGIEKVKAIGAAYYEFFQNEPRHYALMFHQEALPMDPQQMMENPNFARCHDLGNKIFALIQDVVRQGIGDGSMNPGLDPVKVSLVLWSHSAGVLHLLQSKQILVENMFQVSPKELMDYSTTLVMSYLENHEKGKE